jgi:sRNA-binding carbon storage regulator CsrA
MDLYELNFNDSLCFNLKGKEIKLTLLENKVNPDEYAIGVTAPRSVSIDREEIYMRRKQNRPKKTED